MQASAWRSRAARHDCHAADQAVQSHSRSLECICRGEGERQKIIDDLHDHNCIGFRLIGSGGIFDWGTERWRQGSDGQNIRHDNCDGCYPRARYRLGRRRHRLHLRTTGSPSPARGASQWMLPPSAIEIDGLFLYYPRRASLAPKLRAFIDAAKSSAVAAIEHHHFTSGATEAVKAPFRRVSCATTLHRRRPVRNPIRYN